jgi:hypothetical protein
MMRRVLASGLSVFAALALSAFAPSAASLASTTGPVAGAGHVTNHGLCSGPSAWRLDVQRGGASTLLVRFAIAGGRAHQKWNVFLSDDGTGIFAGSRRSRRGGKVRVRVRTADLAGKDKIQAGANNVATGETCHGRVAL